MVGRGGGMEDCRVAHNQARRQAGRVSKWAGRVSKCAGREGLATRQRGPCTPEKVVSPAAWRGKDCARPSSAVSIQACGSQRGRD